MVRMILDPPAHNPLLIPELFRCVLDGLDHRVTLPPRNRDDLRVTQRALASLAQTCRALSDPALDRLWRRLDSLEPLIRCLPPAANRTTSSLQVAERAIVDRYSYRIWELTLQSLIDNLFLLGRASTCFQSHFLFPNLRVLEWSVPSDREDSELTMIMHRLLTPNLVSLSAVVGCRRLDPFLQNYKMLCSGLKTVKLDISQSFFHRDKASTSEIRLLSQATRTQEHLESLALSVPIDETALRHVMLSPQLRAISLILYPVTSECGGVATTSTDVPFRNVEDLELFARDLGSILSLLRPKDQMFRTLRLRTSRLSEAGTILAFWTALVSPLRTGSLQSIYLTFNKVYALGQVDISYDDAIHRLTYDTLHPLTCFKRLRELVLPMFNQTFLNDAELVDLARNWPVLEVFKINSGHGCYDTFVTLRGLLSLLALCPRLRELRLSLDARVVPQENASIRNTLLTSLRLPDSPILDARLVTDFFAKHLPSVTHVDVYFVATPSLAYEPPEEYNVVWAKVNEYLFDG